MAITKTYFYFPYTPSSAPTTSYQAANKKYVDDNSGASVNSVITTIEYNDDVTVVNSLGLSAVVTVYKSVTVYGGTQVWRDCTALMEIDKWATAFSVKNLGAEETFMINYL